MSTHEFRDWAAAARPGLRRTAYLLSGDWHQAEDLTQETLLRIYAVWRRVSAAGPPDAYARKVLVNLHRQALRRPVHREQPAESLPDRPAPGAGPDDDRDELLGALAGLGASQRAIVVLRYWEDLSVAEVADLLRLRPGTVKSQSSRGLASLRALLPNPNANPRTQP